MDDQPDTISVKRAAQILGMTDTTVRKLLAQGRLGGMKERGVWVVFVESVQALLAEREAATVARGRGFHEVLDSLSDREGQNRRRREQRRNQGLG